MGVKLVDYALKKKRLLKGLYETMACVVILAIYF
jgi:hypothetical protein